IGVFYAFALVANLIAAPFNGLLAEQVEKMLDSPANSVPPPSGGGGWRDLVLSPVAGLGRLVYFLLWLIPLIILLFVPVVNVVAPFVWLLSTAWTLALEYADYPLGKRGMSFENQRQLLRRHWPLTLGFGGMTLLLTLIPILNFLAMPAAVIGATLMWNRELADGS
ncbi:MAG: sulfate transporter CysZ, partial [Candidatus Competibacter denitrificans]